LKGNNKSKLLAGKNCLLLTNLI